MRNRGQEGTDDLFSVTYQLGGELERTKTHKQAAGEG